MAHIYNFLLMGTHALQNNCRLVKDHEWTGTTLQIDAYIHSPVLAQNYFSDYEFLL